MKKTLCYLLVLLFLLAVPMAVSAEETGMDWDEVDWKTFDWKQVNGNEVENSLYKWLRDDASLSKLFQANSICTHAAFGESFWDLTYDRFVENPEKFLITLAKEDEQTQERAISCVATASDYQNESTTVNAVKGIRLSKAKNPQAVALMLELIKQIEEMSGIIITPPKTGDPVVGVAAALLLSGAGFVLLRKKR